jgi:hypothetical protein
VREQLRRRAPDSMTISYLIIDGVPVTAHHGTATVVQPVDGSTIEWTYRVAPRTWRTRSARVTRMSWLDWPLCSPCLALDPACNVR